VSSSGTGEYRTAPVEQHLGDRLAAFVDGELTDDGRDRVLAHLATCPQCKAAAAEQRRLKSVVAASELPAISAGLLARLQGLPGMDDDGGAPRNPGVGRPVPEERRGPFDGGLLGSGTFGSGRRGEFSYLAPAPDLVAAADVRSRGFRVHEPSRGRRFAFAAAGAFSMAAIAIGSALPMEAAVDGGARPDEGPAVSPLSANSVSDTRGAVPRGMLDATEENRTLRAPAAMASATSVSLHARSTFVLH
jgi:anti-sigma factor RsiW